MSKDIITADMVGDPNSPLVGMTMFSGEDRVNVGTVYQSAEDLEVVKSLRLPGSMYTAAMALEHPNGFSGVVRDALAKHLNYKPNEAEVKNALKVIETALREQLGKAA